jgi:hypothetical protein
MTLQLDAATLMQQKQPPALPVFIIKFVIF